MEKKIMTNIEILDNLELDIDDFFKKKHINAYNIDSWTDKKSERTFNYTYEIKSNKKIDGGALYDYLFSESDILLHNLDMGVKITTLENTDYYTRVNIIISVPNELAESKKSMKESINGNCYIYYDDEDDNKRLVFCDYVKGITDTSNWFYLNEYIIDAIHIFKNEKQAQKFIDEHLKYFADQDKVVIAEYPQTVSGFFESKESIKESISLETLRNEEHMILEMIDSLKNNKKFNPYEGKYVICCDFFTDKIEFYYLADDVVSHRDIVVGYCDSLKDVNLIINELSNKFKFFESKESATKSIKESDDNWYKLKVLNEMLDAMTKDEYNIPKVGIYGVTKNINLDEGAIRALIKYYK
jgi:hypothetical protein